MSIEDCHPEYLERRAQWARIEDCLRGRDAVIAAGETHVPRLSGHKNPKEYLGYLQRGMWYGATAKTSNAFVGQIFRREPVLVVTRKLEDRVANVNGAGDSFYVFAKEATAACLNKGRYGLLVDVPDDGPDDTPYIAGYSTESIRNWRYRLVGGIPRLDQVILYETVDLPSADGFGSAARGRYRVLELDEEGLYRVRLYDHLDDLGYVETQTIVPRPLLGRRIDYVPFIALGPNNLRLTPDKPPMLDMADLNLTHWQHSVDLASGVHKTAFPVPVISGMDPDAKAEWAVGGSIVWMLPPGAEASMLEFKGDGLGTLERMLEKVEGLMAKLGASMLEDRKRVTETAEALQERSSGESASLADIAKSTADGLLRALRIMAEWVGDDPADVRCELNTDFTAGGLAPQDLLALVTTLEQGKMPLDDFIWNLQRGEVLRPGRSIEEIREEMETDRPLLAAAPRDDLSGGGDAPPGDDAPQPAPGGFQTSSRPARRPNKPKPTR